MIAEEMRKLLENYVAAANAHDGETQLDQMCDEPSFEVIPLGVRLEGRAAISGYWAAVIEAFLDYGRRVEGMAFGEDECVLRWGLLGTARGSALGMEPTGKRIDVPMASFFSFKDGRIECERRLFDVATLCDQAGIPIERVRGPVNIGA